MTLTIVLFGPGFVDIVEGIEFVDHFMSCEPKSSEVLEAPPVELHLEQPHSLFHCLVKLDPARLDLLFHLVEQIVTRNQTHCLKRVAWLPQTQHDIHFGWFRLLHNEVNQVLPFWFWGGEIGGFSWMNCLKTYHA